MGKASRSKLHFFHQLEKDASQLHEQVKDLAGRGVCAINMLKVEVAVLLNIKAFVLDLPAQAPALVGHAIDIMRSQGKVG